MDIILITGYIAGTLSTLSFLPQVLRSWKLKETRDLSILMLILMCIAIGLWAIYGFWMNSLPLFVSNIITFTLVASLLFLKLKYH